MFLGVLMFADAAIKLTEIEVALGDEGPHSELAGQHKGLMTALLGRAGLEPVAMRGYLCEKAKCQRLKASLSPIAGEVERLPSVLGSLGKTPGQEIDLSELTEAGATLLIHHLLARPVNFLEESEGLVVAF